MNSEDFDKQFHLLYEKLSFYWGKPPMRIKLLKALKELIGKYVEGSDDK